MNEAEKLQLPTRGAGKRQSVTYRGWLRTARGFQMILDAYRRTISLSAAVLLCALVQEG